jgi:sugar diacid utilization regulator
MTEKARLRVHINIPLAINGEPVGSIGLKTDDKGKVQPFADITTESKITTVKVHPDGTVEVHVS